MDITGIIFNTGIIFITGIIWITKIIGVNIVDQRPENREWCYLVNYVAPAVKGGPLSDYQLPHAAQVAAFFVIYKVLQENLGLERKHSTMGVLTSQGGANNGASLDE
jgi:hypothetical protein